MFLAACEGLRFRHFRLVGWNRKYGNQKKKKTGLTLVGTEPNQKNQKKEEKSPDIGWNTTQSEK